MPAPTRGPGTKCVIGRSGAAACFRFSFRCLCLLVLSCLFESYFFLALSAVLLILFSKLVNFFDNLLFAQDGHNALDIAQLNGKAGIVGLLTVRILFHDTFLQIFE